MAGGEQLGERPHALQAATARPHRQQFLDERLNGGVDIRCRLARTRHRSRRIRALCLRQSRRRASADVSLVPPTREIATPDSKAEVESALKETIDPEGELIPKERRESHV